MKGRIPEITKSMKEKAGEKVYDANNQALRLDTMGFGKLQILQDPREFCYGIDAVLLADFAAKDNSVVTIYGASL